MFIYFNNFFGLQHFIEFDSVFWISELQNIKLSMFEKNTFIQFRIIFRKYKNIRRFQN